MRKFGPLGGTPGAQFVDSNPGTGTEGSAVPAEAFNSMRDELIEVIEAGGVTPDQGDNTQVRQAIDALILAAVSAVSSGVISVNGQSGVVTIDIPVTSVNGQTGAVTVTVPVGSVNGMIGDVVLDAADVGGVPTSRQILAGIGLTGGGSLLANRTIDADIATGAEIRAGTSNKLIAPDVADQSAEEVTLAFGSTVNWSVTDGFTLALPNITSNFTMANPTVQKPGRTGVFRLFSSVERSISWGSMFQPAQDASLPESVLGEMCLGWSNAYAGRIFVG